MMEIIDWGLIDYETALHRQMGLVEQMLVDREADKLLVGGEAELVKTNKLIFCTHPPVVTIGRGTKPGDVFGWGGAVVEASRGGRATYHGPSQLVIYPIVDLMGKNTNIDIHKYLRTLEHATVETLRELGIEAEARTIKFDDGSPSLTGVWVGPQKIASIGIAVKRGVSYHGISINVTKDPSAFQGINPCGFKSEIMTSIEAVAGREACDLFELKQKFVSHFSL